MSRRLPPSDPNLLTVRWVNVDWRVTVWEDANEVMPWCLVWENSRIDWHHEEVFSDVVDALIRAGVITYVVEHDRRLVQPNLRVMSDYTAFEELVNQLLKYVTADRSSTAQLHHVRR